MSGKASDERTTLQQVHSQSAFDAIISSTPVTTLKVIYFAAPWAAPCEQMSTVLATLASTYPISDPPAIAFLTINTDDLPDIAEQYNVTAVPYVVLQRGDNILDSISGGDAAKVRSVVEKHAGSGASSFHTQLPPAQSVSRPEQQIAPASGGSMSGMKDLVTNKPEKQPDNSAVATQSSQGGPSNQAVQEEDINTRLTKLVKAAPAMLFMKGTPSAPQCGFSRQLVGLLRENGVRYGFFNILADEEVRQGLKLFADWPTFPQLWLDGELVGGLDIVKEELENDPEFLTQYSVNTSKPSTAEPAARPTATA